jgi:cytochrome c-type biogenesis protein CcmE
MKKTHIIGIIIIGIAIALIMSTAGDAGTYVSFDQAKSIAEKNSDKLVHVVGQLPKSNSGEIIGLNESDKLSFSFQLIDENETACIVYYNEPKPVDFERSEKVVVVGKMSGEVFVADKILMKCPSKYVEDEIKIEADA